MIAPSPPQGLRLTDVDGLEGLAGRSRLINAKDLPVRTFPTLGT